MAGEISDFIYREETVCLHLVIHTFLVEISLLIVVQILQTYVKRLLEKGLAEEVSGKLVVPTAVFTQPEMLQGTSELYESVVQMVTSMRAAGFSFGD